MLQSPHKGGLSSSLVADDDEGSAAMASALVELSEVGEDRSSLASKLGRKASSREDLGGSELVAVQDACNPLECRSLNSLAQHCCVACGANLVV